MDINALQQLLALYDQRGPKMRSPNRQRSIWDMSPNGPDESQPDDRLAWAMNAMRQGPQQDFFGDMPQQSLPPAQSPNFLSRYLGAQR